LEPEKSANPVFVPQCRIKVERSL